LEYIQTVEKALGFLVAINVVVVFSRFSVRRFVAPRCTDSAAAVEANALSALEQIQVSGLKIGSVPR